MFNQFNEALPIPKETMRSAKAAFGSQNFYIRVGEHLESILSDLQFEWISGETKTSLAEGATLPLITFFEFIEGLTDDQAANAIRARIDWKFALHLPTTPSIFHPAALCDFRRKVTLSSKGQREFQNLIDRLIKFGPPTNTRSQDFEIMSIISEICGLNRWHWIRQAIHQALGVLAGKYPDLLRQIALPHWYGRFNDLSSGPNPTAPVHQQALSLFELGADIQHLLKEINRSNSVEISELQEIKELRHIWQKQFDGKDLTQFDRSSDSKWTECDFCMR